MNDDERCPSGLVEEWAEQSVDGMTRVYRDRQLLAQEVLDLRRQLDLSVAGKRAIHDKCRHGAGR